MDCATAESGFEGYVYFTDSSSPTLTIPGLFYGVTGVKLS